MASVPQICNMALSHIGADTTVASISPPDGSVEAGLCATFYDQSRTELLEPGNWAFSLKRTLLAEVTNDSDTWAYAYAKPSECLRPVRIISAMDALTVFNVDDSDIQINDRGVAEFDIEGEVIYSNQPDAVLVYVRDITDTTKFTPSFVSALSFLLSSYLAGPVIKGSEGTRVGDAMRQRAYSIGDVSATASANAGATSSTFTPSSVTART